MSKYTIITGDTFEIIARKVYGTEADAGLVQRSNPGVAEPLTPGTVVVIPARPDAPTIAPSTAASDRDNEVAISINGSRFRFWEGVRIKQALDAFDSIEFGAPFEVDNKAFRDTFRPFSYSDIVVTIGGEPLFTGIMVGINPSMEANKRTVTVNGYSLPGPLNDCNSPASDFPLEFNGQKIGDIAKSICTPFGLTVEIDADEGPVFERVASEPTDSPYTFLSTLARQRNMVIASTPEGKLLLRRSVSIGSPVARLEQGFAPVTAVAPQFTPQEYFSHVTGIQPAIVGVGGGQYTVKNSRLTGVIRPFNFTADDTLTADIKEATEAKAGRMFANAVSYSVTVATWRDPSGALWVPNTTITLNAPGAMIYSDYEFIIRSVELAQDNNEESGVLTLVLPGAFDGKIPEVLPWDE